MNKLIYPFICLSLLFIVGCEQSGRSNGFVNDYPEVSWHIGHQSSVDLVKKIDKAWSGKNWNKLETFFYDTAKYAFAGGDEYNSFDGFVSHIKKEMGDNEPNWKMDYAFAVDIAPGTGGEWVNAGFTVDVSDVKPDTSEEFYNEWYYVINGKIHRWSQSKQIILSKK